MACMKNRPRAMSDSSPRLTAACPAASPASCNRPFSQWPWANSTAGRLPSPAVRAAVGRYRLPLTKCPGVLAKLTFSMLYPSRSTLPWTTASSGVFSGSGHNPSATATCSRTNAFRACQAATSFGGVKPKKSFSVFGAPSRASFAAGPSAAWASSAGAQTRAADARPKSRRESIGGLLGQGNSAPPKATRVSPTRQRGTQRSWTTRGSLTVQSSITNIANDLCVPRWRVGLTRRTNVGDSLSRFACQDGIDRGARPHADDVAEAVAGEQVGVLGQSALLALRTDEHVQGL